MCKSICQRNVDITLPIHLGFTYTLTHHHNTSVVLLHSPNKQQKVSCVVCTECDVLPAHAYTLHFHFDLSQSASVYLQITRAIIGACGVSFIDSQPILSMSESRQHTQTRAPYVNACIFCSLVRSFFFASFFSRYIYIYMR